LSADAERTKRLIEFKKKLEDRIENLTSELNDSQTMLEALNSILLEKGFRHLQVPAETAKTAAPPTTEKTNEGQREPTPPQPHTEPDNITPLQTTTGELLANLQITEDQLRVVLAEDKDFNPSHTSS
jgi:hypothetical protein